MSEKPTGGPAFPAYGLMGDNGIISSNDWQEGGMTIRDYFAAKAMLGYLSVVETHLSIQAKQFEPDGVAAVCYEWADAMLKAREAK